MVITVMDGITLGKGQTTSNPPRSSSLSNHVALSIYIPLPYLCACMGTAGTYRSSTIKLVALAPYAGPAAFSSSSDAAAPVGELAGVAHLDGVLVLRLDEEGWQAEQRLAHAVRLHLLQPPAAVPIGAVVVFIVVVIIILVIVFVVVLILVFIVVLVLVFVLVIVLIAVTQTTMAVSATTTPAAAGAVVSYAAAAVGVVSVSHHSHGGVTGGAVAVVIVGDRLDGDHGGHGGFARGRHGGFTDDVALLALVAGAAPAVAATAAIVVIVLVFIFIVVLVFVLIFVVVLVIVLVIVMMVVVLRTGGWQDGAGLASDGELREAELLGLCLGARHAEEREKEDRGEDHHLEHRRGSHAQPKPRPAARSRAVEVEGGFLQCKNAIGVRCRVDGWHDFIYIHYTHMGLD
jgi:hypothetical protein